MEKHLKIEKFRYRFLKISTGVLIMSFVLSLFSIAYGINEQEKKPLKLYTYNHFFHKDGLFSFDYSNNYKVETDGSIYYLRELKSNKVSFLLFENKKNIDYESNLFICNLVNQKTFCYSKDTPSYTVKNLTFYKTQDEFLKTKFIFYTRAEALSDVLHFAYPKMDFRPYAENCFNDISKFQAFSGEVCYAKKMQLVNGIAGNFNPNVGVNVWGVLIFLFKTYNTGDLLVNDKVIEKRPFELMTKYHEAYPLIRKAYYEGLFDNTENSDIWPNRVIYKAEAHQIIQNFFDWQNGKTIRNYYEADPFETKAKIFINSFYEFEAEEKATIYDQKEIDKIREENAKAFIETKNDKQYFYYPSSQKVYNNFHILKNYTGEKIEAVYIDFNQLEADKFEFAFFVEYKKGVFKRFKTKLTKKTFKDLKNEDSYTLIDPNILPNPVNKIEKSNPYLADISIKLKEEDFRSIFENRTINTRYPAWLKIDYPEGEDEEFSVLIKTRGNAGRGYIKSSYTIESFSKLDQNLLFSGDEFLDKSDEFILRSGISEETHIPERLIYEAFEKLGHPAPKFFNATVNLNGTELGLYQVTEDIKSSFFKSRGISVTNYYQPKNRNNKRLANLSYLGGDTETLDFYESKQGSDPKKLLNFIKALSNNDPEIIKEIDVQNIFDYAFLTYITTANDSIAYNYYLYYDDDKKLWKMTFWDADSAFNYVPQISKTRLKEFMSSNTGIFNNAFLYLHNNLSEKEFNDLYKDFVERWKKNINFEKTLDFYTKEFSEVFSYNEKLWNNKFLERNKTVVNTEDRSKKLREVIIGIKKL